MKVKGWRYGIIKHLNPGGDYFAIHEIYRDGDEISWSLNPITILAEDASEIHSEVAMISRDIVLHDIIVVDENNNLVK